MEDKRYIKSISASFLGILIVFPAFVFAYSDETTHPALTRETAKLFGERNPDQAFTEAEMQLLMRGATDEDASTRPLQHFYDPVHNTGLIIAGAEWESAPEWAYNTKTQVAYAGNIAKIPGIDKLYGTVKKTYSADTDYSWQRAIFEYAWGDKARALETLGHILHLVQDMSVPAHTRNDPHPHRFFGVEAFGGPSPYENFAARFMPENIAITNNISADIPTYVSLEEYLSAVAVYSNKNFFSKDSVPHEGNQYNSPDTNDFDRSKRIGNRAFEYARIGEDSKEYGIAVIKVDGLTKKKDFYITDPDNLILSGYWQLLSRQAVSHGAGVIELFFKKVAEERETKKLAMENRDWSDKIYDKMASIIYNVTDGLYGISVPYEELNTPGSESVERDTGERVGLKKEEKSADNQQAVVARVTRTEEEKEDEPKSKEREPQQLPKEAAEETGDIEKESERVQSESTLEQSSDASEEAAEETAQSSAGASSGSGYVPSGGSGGSSGDSPENSDENGNTSNEKTEPVDNTPPAMPDIAGIATTSPRMVVGTTTAVFTGTAEASSTIEAVYNPTATTTVDTSGNWALELAGLPQGTTTIAFTAIDAAGNRSTSTEAAVFVDSQAPSVHASIERCSTNNCLVATTTLSIQWDVSKPASDFSYFAVSKNGAFSTTTATSTTATSTEYAHYSFAVSAHDIYGNASATTTLQIQTASRPVVINEVAWMGTESSAADEWIELYNPTEYAVDLSGWVLRAEDGDPFIELDAKTLPAGGYYLLERTDDETVKDISADQIFTGVMNNRGGDPLTLEMPTGVGTTTRVVDVAPANGGGYYPWCGGLHRVRLTMERISPAHAGSDCDNWSTALDNFVTTGLDADGNPISGTPKARNTANYHPGGRFLLSDDVVLSKEGSPYLITGGMTIASGDTLTIEPGVVVKIVSPQAPRITVRGTLHAEGTPEEPVVFTSFADDSYGGDMNGDGKCEPDNASSTAKCPVSGSWRQILISHADAPVVLKHTIIRYGGTYYTPADTEERSMVAIVGTPAELSNVQIEGAVQNGLYLENATTTIEHSVFQDNWNRNDLNRKTGTGVYAVGDSPVVVLNSTFARNDRGAYIKTPGRVVDNSFSDNHTFALYGTTGLGRYEGNSGSGNGINGIVLSSPVTREGATTTLRVNQLSYYIAGNAEVVASSTLAFEPGAVMKFSDSGRVTVHNGGYLYHEGVSPNEVIFTSRHDDTAGNALEASSATSSAGNWYGIQVNQGGTLKLHGFTLRYAGKKRGFSSQQHAGLHFDDRAATSSIAHARIVENENEGVYLAGNTRLTLSDAVVFGNEDYDIHANNGASAVCAANCTIGTTSPPDLFQ